MRDRALCWKGVREIRKESEVCAALDVCNTTARVYTPGRPDGSAREDRLKGRRALSLRRDSCALGSPRTKPPERPTHSSSRPAQAMRAVSVVSALYYTYLSLALSLSLTLSLSLASTFLPALSPHLSFSPPSWRFYIFADPAWTFFRSNYKRGNVRDFWLFADGPCLLLSAGIRCFFLPP